MTIELNKLYNPHELKNLLNFVRWATQNRCNEVGYESVNKSIITFKKDEVIHCIAVMYTKYFNDIYVGDIIKSIIEFDHELDYPIISQFICKELPHRDH
jgi:hypothetical protein